MFRLFDMIWFYVRDFPDIRWILAQGIAAKLSFFGALVMPFPRILLRHAHGIKIETVVVTFGEPQHCFMTSAESPVSVHSVSERPNDPIPE